MILLPAGIELPEMPVTHPAIKCTNADVEKIEGFMLQVAKLIPTFEQTAPVSHSFQDGVYLREILMQTGQFVVGHEHLTEHFNLILSGSATVVMHDMIIDAAPFMMIRSAAGVRKLLMIHAPMRWLTIHKNPRNLGRGLDQSSPEFAAQLAELEAELFKPSETFLAHKATLPK